MRVRRATGILRACTSLAAWLRASGRSASTLIAISSRRRRGRCPCSQARPWSIDWRLCALRRRRARTAAANAMKANAKWPCLLTVLLWFALYKGIFKQATCSLKTADCRQDRATLVVRPPPNASANNLSTPKWAAARSWRIRLASSTARACRAAYRANSAELRQHKNCTTWAETRTRRRAGARVLAEAPRQPVAGHPAARGRRGAGRRSVPPPKVAAGVAPPLRAPTRRRRSRGCSTLRRRRPSRRTSTARCRTSTAGVSPAGGRTRGERRDRDGRRACASASTARRPQ